MSPPKIAKLIISYLRKLNTREQFRPTRLSILYNANYFIKKGVYQGVKCNSNVLKGKLLDIGCGHKPYRDLFNVLEYIGIDIENEAHDQTSDAVDVIFDGRKIPFDDQSFDSVFSSEVFEHVFHLEELIQESNRILKVGGKILITLPFVWIEHEKPNDFARYTTFGIINLLERNGFIIEHSEKSSTYIEAIFQMIAAYIYQTIIPKNSTFNWPLTVLLISPINMIGIVLSCILPNNNDFYLNNVIVASKTNGANS
jgi:SAM-dependent methyltransferase